MIVFLARRIMNLYIDIGNSYIKFSTVNQDKINTSRYMTKTDYTSDSLFNLLSEDLKEKDYKNIFISSVVPVMNNIINEICSKFFNKEPRYISHPMKTGIKIQTNNPKEVGSDLVCLAAYASTLYEESIIVNLGTATTITHVNNKTLEGVIISSGLSVQFGNLVTSASKIPNVELKKTNRVFGKDTEESISIGILNGHACMIEGLIKRLNKDIPVIISGGNSQYIKDIIDLECDFVEEATTRGMIEIAKANNY